MWPGDGLCKLLNTPLLRSTTFGPLQPRALSHQPWSVCIYSLKLPFDLLVVSPSNVSPRRAWPYPPSQWSSVPSTMTDLAAGTKKNC